MTKKFFTEKQTAVAAALAGPVPAGILIFLNYKALEKDKEAIISLAFTLFFSAIIFSLIFILPEELAENSSNFVFTATYGLLVFLFYQKFMSADIKRELEAGAKKRSGWTVAGITVLGMILSLAILAGIAADQPFYDGELVESNGNELYHQPEIPATEVDKLLIQLQAQGFFGENYGNIARMELIAGDYFITLVVDESLWTDQEIISQFTSMKWLLEVEFNRKIHLTLASISIGGNTQLKHIDEESN